MVYGLLLCIRYSFAACVKYSGCTICRSTITHQGNVSTFLFSNLDFACCKMAFDLFFCLRPDYVRRRRCGIVENECPPLSYCGAVLDHIASSECVWGASPLQGWVFQRRSRDSMKPGVFNPRMTGVLGMRPEGTPARSAPAPSGRKTAVCATFLGLKPPGSILLPLRGKKPISIRELPRATRPYRLRRT